MLEFKRRSSISSRSLSLLYDDIPRGWRLGIYYSLKGCTLQFLAVISQVRYLYLSVVCLYWLSTAVFVWVTVKSLLVIRQNGGRFWFRHVLLLIWCKSFLLLTPVYAGVGSGYSVWMLVRCMVSNVLVFASVIVTLDSAVLLVAWQGCCVCPVLQRGGEWVVWQLLLIGLVVVVGGRCCCLWVIFSAILLQLFYYCVEDLIRRFYVFFVEMVVVCDFFMYIESLYSIEVGSFFLEM